MARKSMNVVSPDGWKVNAEHWSIKTLYNMHKKNRIDFDSHVQRGDVWDVPRRSLYIHSLLSGMLAYNIPYLYSKDGNIYHCIDGKQRGTALIEFIKDRYPLRGILGEKVYSEEQEEWVEINNKKFSQLEQEFQDKILDFSLSVAVIESTTGEPIPPEIEAEFFRRANAGKPVSNADIAMSTSKCVDSIRRIVGVAEYDDKGKPITGSNFFMDAYGKKRFRAGTIPKEIVLKAYYLLYKQGNDESYYTFAKLSEISQDAYISEEEEERLKAVFDKVYKAFQATAHVKTSVMKVTVRRALGKNLLLAYIPYIDRFKDPEQLAEFWLYCFEELPDDLSQMLRENTGGVRKAKAIQGKVEAMINDFLNQYDEIYPKFKDMGIDIRIGEDEQQKQ